MQGWSPSPFRVGVGAAGLLAASLVLECCSHGEGIPGEPAGGASGGAQTPQLERGEASPGLVAEVLAVEGGTRGGGTFGAGDTVSFTFSVTRADGSPWTLGEVSTGRAMLSGPPIATSA